MILIFWLVFMGYAVVCKNEGIGLIANWSWWMVFVPWIVMFATAAIKDLANKAKKR